jgi:hypothetical protein
MLSASPTDATPNAEALVPPILNGGSILHVIANRLDPRAADGMALSGLATSLRTLVEQTHGQYTPIYTAASHCAALDQIAERMATEIMIEPGPGAVEGERREGRRAILARACAGRRRAAVKLQDCRK